MLGRLPGAGDTGAHHTGPELLLSKGEPGCCLCILLRSLYPQGNVYKSFLHLQHLSVTFLYNDIKQEHDFKHVKRTLNQKEVEVRMQT